MIRTQAFSRSPFSYLALFILFLSSGLGLSDEHWRLSEVLDLPEWLQISGQYRVRYEAADGSYRPGPQGEDQLMAFRTTLKLKLERNGWFLTGELLDARQAFSGRVTPLGTDDVNALEMLQGHLGWRKTDVFRNGDQLSVKAGRQTLDLPSRRLVARNRYRNTMNAFNGVLGRWDGEGGELLQAFWFLPVSRLPRDAASLRDNQMAFDQEDFRRQFWGLHGSLQGLPLDGVGELYLLGLHERDSARRATRNRRLYTSGFRWSRKPATGRFHYDWESALQVGTSRATRAFADTSDLNHLAHMHSIEVGYTLEAPTTPRMALIHEYASGDRDPFDAGNNRFDTLYGARRFAHGPTGIWGAFARSNINSPGYLLSLSPLPDIRLMVKHRFYWLASRRDAWTTTGVRDVTGNFGNLVGHQVESRLRWEALPGNLRVEIGIAHLFDNEFIQSGTNEGAVTYGYGQCILTF